MSEKNYKIAIFGAGSIGCYVGGRLMSGGARVTMIGRPRMQAVLQEHPLKVTDYEGFSATHHLDQQTYVTSADAAADADLVLVTVKSAATTEAGETLAPHVRPGTPVISLQNGISNAAQLKKAMPKAQVFAGMVPFNVLQQSAGHFHQGTEGHLMAAQDAALDACLPFFASAGLPLELRDDIESVMWSKLLLNLNNPINALSGVPLLEELNQRSYRLALAMAQRETLRLLKRAGMPTVKLTGLPNALIPTLMASPNWVFTRVAKQMLTIDPVARSSMWEDLQAGRPTEIDWINGEVVRLAESLGTTAPVNQRLVELMHQQEQAPRPWKPDALLAELKSAQS